MATTTDPAAPVCNPFGDVITARWRELSMHQAKFCRLVGAPAGWVQQIREAKKTPPLDRMPEWARALELTGARRALFLDLAVVMHVPASHRARFARLVMDAHAAAGAAVAARLGA
jgi:hypothetical protein